MSWKGRVHLIKIECWSKIGILVYASHIGLLEFSCLGLCKPVQSNSGLHACNQNLFPSSTMGRVAGLVLSKGCRAYGRTFSQFTSHRAAVCLYIRSSSHVPFWSLLCCWLSLTCRRAPASHFWKFHAAHVSFGGTKGLIQESEREE